MAARGVLVSYETVRRWCDKFGGSFSVGLSRRRARTGDVGQSVPQETRPAAEISTWDSVMFRAARTASTTPLVMTRVAAIVQGAVFDAVNGIDNPYCVIPGFLKSPA